jgi:hypothetical protein
VRVGVRVRVRVRLRHHRLSEGRALLHEYRTLPTRLRHLLAHLVSGDRIAIGIG